MLQIFSAKQRLVGAFRWPLLFLLVGLLLPSCAHAQLSAYAEFTASDLHEGPSGDDLYGGTVGVLLDGPIFFKRIVASADVQVRDVNNGGERLVGVAIGPRVSFPLKRLKLTPYAEFMVGFARYRASDEAGAENTTDDQWQTNAGVSRQISSHLDIVADYSYSQFGANLGQYRPKSYSVGVVFHLAKR